MQFQLFTILLALGLISQAAALNCYATLDLCNQECGNGEFPCSETSGAPANAPYCYQKEDMGKAKNEALSSAEPHKRPNAKAVIAIIIPLEELIMQAIPERPVIARIVPCDGQELWRDVQFVEQLNTNSARFSPECGPLISVKEAHLAFQTRGRSNDQCYP
ncbi:hypothetical protein AnigIFM59636_003735 [Aspergillus niger]|nr:hypothetical protein AnigIFM59636_003735 [Aspergillus niger]